MNKTIAAFGLILFLGAGRVQADEGMWLISNPPRARLAEKCDFKLSDDWLEHAMKASVKFSGASGSFVSSDGLILTNHHVGRSYVQKLSTEEKNYAVTGFHALAPADELRVPGMEVSVLQSTEDVTARVNAAVSANATDSEAAAARRTVFTEIESESKAATGLTSTVVTLYQGGQYHLYRYKRYSDVRLAFVPETSIAAFGGDADNFEYPRYCLDFCLFRAYENGAPAKVEHFLRLSKAQVNEGDLIFVTGHPGHTDRQLTLAEIAYLRDISLPRKLAGLVRTEVVLTTWAARSSENRRRAGRVLFGTQNNRKRSLGQLAALQDPAFFARLEAREDALKRELSAHREKSALRAFGTIAAAQKKIADLSLRYSLLEGSDGFEGNSFNYARELLRGVDERAKPNSARLRAYTDARKDSFEETLFSASPVYADVDQVLFADSLGVLVAELGANDPVVRAVLNGKSPRERAVDLIRGTQVRDPAVRRKLYEGGAAALADAKDPMIELARLIDGESRALRTALEAENERIAQAHAEIARAKFALHGSGQYPDATGTLRLSYGTVRGYTEDNGPVPFQTVTSGLFKRNRFHQDREPFDLPQRWIAALQTLNPDTPFNFVTTIDSVGGNSGSPVLNRKGELVGLLFDGNLASLSGNLAYSDRTSRSVNVSPAIILESLHRVYGAEAIARELEQGHR